MTHYFFNLWLYLVVGYGIIWAAMALADRKRGTPIEDRELYVSVRKSKFALFGYLPLFALLMTSVFLPIAGGAQYRAGLAVASLGVFINCLSMYFFSRQKGGLMTLGIYRFSRNPMYVGGFLFLLGLNFLAWEAKGPNYLFAALTLFWAAATHWIVLQEEAFLRSKYGERYMTFLKRVPRYIGFPKGAHNG
jgi:protein-S-isoprenylcysteine O-methyltransferase Ste14